MKMTNKTSSIVSSSFFSLFASYFVSLPLSTRISFFRMCRLPFLFLKIKKMSTNQALTVALVQSMRVFFSALWKSGRRNEEKRKGREREKNKILSGIRLRFFLFEHNISTQHIEHHPPAGNNAFWKRKTKFNMRCNTSLFFPSHQATN